ncbi:MAG: hypothetical protein RLZZ461_1255 [Planctomycetota bacterium]|jgi:hypothetical protein
MGRTLIHRTEDGVAGTIFTRSDERYAESVIRDLILHHPDVLGVEDVHGMWDGMVSLAVEVGVEGKWIDVLLVNRHGRLAIVETKLFRNPEATRSVVGQTLEYAARLSKWTPERLEEAVIQAARNCGIDEGRRSLVELARVRGLNIPDEKRFLTNLKGNMEIGHFLLVIAGDEIRPEAEMIRDFLDRSPQLGFSLGLVELHRHAPESESAAELWSSRLVAAAEAVLRLEKLWIPEDVGHPKVREYCSSGVGSSGRTRRSTSDNVVLGEFLEELEASMPPPRCAIMRDIWNGLDAIDGVELRPQRSSVTVRCQAFSLLNVGLGGKLTANHLRDQLIDSEVDRSCPGIDSRLLGGLADKVEGWSYAPDPKPKSDERHQLFGGDGQPGSCQLIELVAAIDSGVTSVVEVLDLFRRAVEEIRQARAND